MEDNIIFALVFICFIIEKQTNKDQNCFSTYEIKNECMFSPTLFKARFLISLPLRYVNERLKDYQVTVFQVTQGSFFFSHWTLPVLTLLEYIIHIISINYWEHPKYFCWFYEYKYRREINISIFRLFVKFHHDC